MTKNTSTEVTDDQIAALRTAAAQAGDHSQVLLCDRALGAVDSDEGLDHLRIWTFIGEADRRLHRSLTDAECRDICAAVAVILDRGE